MKKLVIFIAVVILFTGCSMENDVSNISSEDIASIVSEPILSTSVSSEPISEPSSDMVSRVTEKNSTVASFELAVKEMSSNLQEGDNWFFFTDEAYYSYSDFDNDGNLELLWAIYDYRFSAVFIFEKRDDEVYLYDSSMRCSYLGYQEEVPIKIEFFAMKENFIVKNSYRDNSGVGEFSAQERFFEFRKLDQNKMEIFSMPLYQWRGDETPEIGEKFFKEQNDIWDNDVTKEEFDKHIASLTEDFISKEIVNLDNHVIDYMQNDNLYNALYESYQEYQERIAK